MVTLLKFSTSTETINIMQKVSPQYKAVGTILLDDRDGNRLKAIEKSCKDDVDAITHEIFQEWITKDSNPTWGKLVECLKDASLHPLAKNIENCFPRPI